MIEDAVVFPSELHTSVDKLVASAHAGVREPRGNALKLVTSWCEQHADESGLESGEHGAGFMIVWLNEALVEWSDREIEMAEGYEPAEITNEIRVSFIRGRLESIFDGTDDAEVYPMGCTVRIKSSTGDRASLAYSLSGGGYMGGPGVSWHGVYRSHAAFRATIRRLGGLTSKADADKMSDATLLRRRRRAAIKAPRRRSS
jgi:hypothetical protein